MKTGTKCAIAGCLLTCSLLLIKLNSQKKFDIVDKESDPSKFGNRLKEFFFDEALESATKEYLSLIDAGFNPKDAYELVRSKI